MPLSDVQQKVVLHWGEMGSRWGINRTVAQIHALLFLSQRPLDAEEICETLQLARSNVSTSLRELQGWGIVRLVHVAGDRRDHFEALADFWETFRIILIERRKREWEPTRQFLQNCLDEKQGDDENAFVRERISNMHDFFDTAGTWFDRLTLLPLPALKAFLRMRLPGRKKKKAVQAKGQDA